MNSSSPLRILYLSGGRGFSATAVPRKFASIVGCWRAQGHLVELVCGGDLPGSGYVPNRLDAPSRPLTRLPWYRRTTIFDPIANSVSERRDILHDQTVVEHLRRLTRRQRFDLIWERSCRLHQAGLVVARELGLPYVLEWKDHLIRYRFSRHHARAVAVEERKNRQADCVVVESEVLRRQLGREGVDAAKIIVAHNAADPKRFQRDPALRESTRRKLGVADDEVLAGCVGGYQFYHDPVRLVLAADILRKQNQRKLKIMMVGDGTEHFKTRRLAEKLRLLESDRFLMKPRIPPSEVPGILAALDVAVLPGSTDIICPIKVQEYMAAELPSVLPDYPANREVIAHGETGLFFRPKDESALAEALRALAEDCDCGRRMGEHARRVACERFTWEKTWGAALTDALRLTRATSVL